MLHLIRMRTFTPNRQQPMETAHTTLGAQQGAPSDPQLHSGGWQEPPQHLWQPHEGFLWIPATASAPPQQSWHWAAGAGNTACLSGQPGGEHWGSHAASHPISSRCSTQLQGRQLQVHNIFTLQFSRAPLLLIYWVDWVLRELDIFNLFLNVQHSPICYPEIYSAFTEKILL